MIKWYLEACENAVCEVVLQGGIAAETQAVLDRNLITDVDHYRKMANIYWDKVLSGELEFEPEV